MSTQDRGSRGKRSPAEWATFAIAFAVLLAVTGSVAWLWVTDEGRPAAVEVRSTGPARAAGGRFDVPVTIVNRGDRTAENVQVLAELSRGGAVVEDGEQAIDFLAGGETAQVHFLFTEDPGSGELKVRAASYVEP